MAAPQGSASYKKKEGTLALSDDRETVRWTPFAAPAGPSVVSFGVSTITNLQQTPASSAKVMLKIFSQLPGAPAPETHVFTFTAPSSARAEADAIKDALSIAIQAIKGRSDLGLAAAGAAVGGSQALAIGKAVSSTADTGSKASGWYDDARLLSDVELQKSLLKADAALQKTFMESLRTKPESISNAHFTAQFWSTRIPLLRAHAIDKNQSRGAYNVLSTIKSRTDDNVTRLSISKEQIQLIFSQHPLIKRVYDENVPKVNESAFWAKFFQSRLFKKLKGEKIVDTDPFDPIIDKYLRENEDVGGKSGLVSDVHVPHIIDIEGNEENHSQRRGNQPDLTMRPANLDKAPIIRTLNRLSERIMAEMAPADAHRSHHAETAEGTFRELELHDLQGDADEHRIILNIKDQQRFFAEGTDRDGAEEATSGHVTDPAQALSLVGRDLQQAIEGPNGMSLKDAIGFDEASDDDEDDEDDDDEEMAENNVEHKPGRLGSKASLAKATKQVLGAVAQRRAQTDVLRTSSSAQDRSSMTAANPYDISAALFDRVTLTHATTTEFLHHFWTVFLSGDAARADELTGLAESLDRATTRFEAVAQAAEAERGAEIERRKQEVRDVYQATGKKIRFRPDMIAGGEKAVVDTLAPTVKAVGLARTQYKKALVAAGAKFAET
ncbi:MAG: RNA polymerase II transcription factor B subunit 1 [Lichina confinis]|nr:MAG: RNA polymerase II transcription factor B subunit 1 [Lichina confinis]